MSDIVLGIRLTADGKGLVGEVRLSAEELKKLRQSAGEATDGLGKYSDAQGKAAEATRKGTSAAAEFFKGMLAYDVVKQAGRALLDYAKDAAQMSARYETLGVVMGVVGRNAGYSAGEMQAHAEEVRKSGITMLQSRETVIKLAQAHIDLSEASKLARLAQDAAVIGNVNSSEALQRLIYGIQSAQPEMLRTLGINVNFEASYAKLSKQLGVTTGQLTEQEKAQARMNTVYEAGTGIMGAYEASLGTAGKMMGSLARYSEDLKVLRGQIFNEALFIAVSTYTDHLKDATDQTRKLSEEGALQEWGRSAIGVLAFVGDSVRGVINLFQVMGRAIAVTAQAAISAEKIARLGSNPLMAWQNAGKIAEEYGHLKRFMAAGDEDITQLLQQPTVQNQAAAYFAKRDAERPTARDLDDADVTALAGYTRRVTPGARPAGKAKKPKAITDTGESLVMSLQNQLESLHGEASEFDKVMRQITEGTKKFSLESTAAALALAGEIDEWKQMQEVMKSNATAMEAQTKALEERDTVTTAFHSTNARTLQDLQFETELYGAQKSAMSGLYTTQADLARAQLEANIQRETSVRLRQLELEYNKAAVAITSDETRSIQETTAAVARLTEAYERQREALGLGIRGNLTAQFGVQQLDQERQAAQRFNDNLESGLIDSIFRGFEGGKSAARNFFDSIKNMAKTTVLTPLIKWIVSPITQTITGAIGSLGIPGLANAAGGGGGGVSSLFSGASSLSNLMSGGGIGGAIFGSAGAYAAAVPGLTSAAVGSQAAMLAAQTGAFGAAGLGSTVAAGGGVAAGGALGAIGAAMPYIGAALVAAQMLGVFGKKKDPAVGTGYTFMGDYTPGAGVSNFEGRGNYTAGSRSGYDILTSQDVHVRLFEAAIEPVFEEFTQLAKSLNLSTAAIGKASFNLTTPGIGQAHDDASKPAAAAQLANQWAEQLMPNLREMAQANEELIDTFRRLAQARREADLGAAFGAMGAALSLADSSRGLWMSELSPLTNRQRLGEAASGYTVTRLQAQSGDIGAMTRLADVARTYLAEARGFYASSEDYTRIFSEVQAQIGDLVTDTMTEQATRLVEMGVSLKDIQANTQGLDSRIAGAIGAAEQAAALGGMGMSLGLISATLEAEIREMVAHGMRFDAMVSSLRGLDAGTIEQVARLTGMGATLEAATALLGSQGGTLAEQSIRLAALGFPLADIAAVLHLSSGTQAEQLARLQGSALSLDMLSTSMTAQAGKLSEHSVTYSAMLGALTAIDVGHGGTLADHAARLASVGLSVSEIVSLIGSGVGTQAQQLAAISATGLSVDSMNASLGAALGAQVSALSAHGVSFEAMLTELRETRAENKALLTQLKAAVESQTTADVAAQKAAADQVVAAQASAAKILADAQRDAALMLESARTAALAYGERGPAGWPRGDNDGD